ncbi:MAG: alpha/beta hydrolase [Pseudomonadota bacterium]
MDFGPGVEAGEVVVGDLKIAYVCRPASDKTLLFIHGNSGSKAAFYQQFAGFANTEYTLIALDLPGHGGSSNSHHPEQYYNFPALALLVKRFCDALNVKSPVVVGWSLGGHVVLEMAGRGFALAGAMICGTPPITTGMDDFNAAFLPSEAMAVTLNPAPTSAELTTYIQGLYGSLTPVPTQFHQDAARMDGAVRAHIGAHWGTGEQGCDQKTVAAGWHKPLAVVHGDADAFVSKDYLTSITWRSLWRDQIQFLPGVGHAPFLEAPVVFNELLNSFAADVLR